MTETTHETRMPLLGDPAPTFTAQTTRGEINFPGDYAGKWVILFSHPADFTSVCTTEILTFAHMADEFKALNTELIGLSVDSLNAHLAWLKDIRSIEFNGMKNVKTEFPIIEDIKMEVSKKYGMIHEGMSNTQAVRAVFIIDPQGFIRLIIYYPPSTGRNFQEIKRTLIALQKSDTEGIATPADWQPGDDVVVPTPPIEDYIEQYQENLPDTDYCLSWYLCLRKES